MFFSSYNNDSLKFVRNEYYWQKRIIINFKLAFETLYPEGITAFNRNFHISTVMYNRAWKICTEALGDIEQNFNMNVYWINTLTLKVDQSSESGNSIKGE
jgi:hypothetical protein